MPFTAQELANISNATLDFHERGAAESQVKQRRPLVDDLEANKKTFPGGDEFITGAAKGVYTTTLTGYEHDDEQAYVNPANVKRYRAKWYELGGGIMVTYTELKKNGISVVDSDGSNTVQHSKSELVQLVNLLEDKIEDMNEGTMRSFAEICWRDGTQDAKVFPGILSIISKSPNVGVTHMLDRATNPWYRNRAVIGMSTADPSQQTIVNTLQREFRQLRRFGNPKHKMYAGSDFLDAFEKELRAKGNYTLEGWAKSGRIDASMADLAFKGIAVEYDPTLDDVGEAKSLYVIDHNGIQLRPMDGEEWRVHSPERPPEKYVMYRAKTWTGALVGKRLNTSGVYTIA